MRSKLGQYHSNTPTRCATTTEGMEDHLLREKRPSADSTSPRREIHVKKHQKTLVRKRSRVGEKVPSRRTVRPVES